MGRYFGTDGVRGLANSELTPELAFKVGRAGAYVLSKRKNHAPRIIIASDTRRSCFMLEAAISAGICSVGGSVVLAGVLPTPAIAYLTKRREFDAGIVISASHNSFEDNGIKFFGTEGYKLPDETENEIENYIENIDKIPNPTGDKVGTGERKDYLEEYINFLKKTSDGLDLKGIKIAVDCANGATYRAAPSVLFELGASVFVINNEPDGKNINRKCGSTNMAQLIEYVNENHMDLGIAFDGDGDRCHLVDENGKDIKGDEIMSICACHMRDAGKLNKNTLIATIMSNLGLFMMGEREKIAIEKTQVGDRLVLERMLEGGFNLGGEQSGHIIFSDYNTTGDGILTALQVLKIMTETGKKLSELNTKMEIMPQALINANVPNSKKYNCLNNEKIKKAVDEITKKFDGRGRVVIRPSGTESYVRIMIEGKDKKEITDEAQKLAALIEAEMN
ncbi:MAG: phosphoglucosamine mutase [Clostridiales bacterium]|jgi:phosphoglucosamine mutase|nr:phosphoglucosamine mutase [Clostridiales bacterium]